MLDLIDMLDRGDSGADERWMLAVYGIDRLLDDFGIKLNMKHSILQEMRDLFAKEFGMDPESADSTKRDVQKRKKAT